jgi:hypothetical protein
MSLLFLDLQGALFHSPSRVEDHSEFHSLPEAFGHMSPHCPFSDLGPFRLTIFAAQVGNRTCAHGNESNPLDISMSSAMKGEPGLATGLTTLGALHPFFHSCMTVRSPKLVSSEDRGQGPICFLLLYRGSSPFTHCATSANIGEGVAIFNWLYLYISTHFPLVISISALLHIHTYPSPDC